MDTRTDPVPPYGYDSADEWTETFEEASLDVLAELRKKGHFGENRPEDDVANKLAECDLEELTEEGLDLYEERVIPLLRVAFDEPERFAEEYAERRAPGYYAPPRDDRQLELFAARAHERHGYVREHPPAADGTQVDCGRRLRPG